MTKTTSLSTAVFLYFTGSLLFAQAPLETGPGAVLETFGFAEQADTVSPGTPLFIDRYFAVNDECPKELRGLKLLRGSIEQVAVRCTREGFLTILTPNSDHPISDARSREAELLEAGFTRVGVKPFALIHNNHPYGKKPYDIVHTFQKWMKTGESLTLRKWVVLIGFSEVKFKSPPRPSWKAAKGEILYNGIQLPEEWPPRYIHPLDIRPMPVPYLDALPKVLPIDLGRQLFVDDFLIDRNNLKRTFHKPVKHEGNPVLKAETPLEMPKDHLAMACPKSGGLWWDAKEQLFKLWYEAGWLGTIACATSRDGLNWDRPNFDINPGTNQVLPMGLETPMGFDCDSSTVVRDYWTDDPAQQYKMFLRCPGKKRQGAMCFVSTDGIHWSDGKEAGKFIESGLMGDRSTMFYNPFRKKWIFSLRDSFRGRSRRYREADDFLTGSQWIVGEPAIWAAADEKDLPDPEIGQTTQLYNLDAVAYESIMLGFFQIHRGPPNRACMATGHPKITELNFAYSRDGFHWDRPDRSTTIAAERHDVWDRGYVQSLGNICTVRGEEIWFYYSAFSGDSSKLTSHWTTSGMHGGGATGIAKLRRDGFVSMDANQKKGTLTTRPVMFKEGRHLFVNVDTAEGTFRAEVLDKNATPIAPFTLDNCQPISADSTLTQVTWKNGNDLAKLRGRVVRLRFELTNGRLYSFWVSPDTTGRSDGYVAGGGPGFTGPTDTVGYASLKAERQLNLKEQPK